MKGISNNGVADCVFVFLTFISCTYYLPSKLVLSEGFPINLGDIQNEYGNFGDDDEGKWSEKDEKNKPCNKDFLTLRPHTPIFYMDYVPVQRLNISIGF